VLSSGKAAALRRAIRREPCGLSALRSDKLPASRAPRSRTGPQEREARFRWPSAGAVRCREARPRLRLPTERQSERSAAPRVARWERRVRFAIPRRTRALVAWHGPCGLGSRARNASEIWLRQPRREQHDRSGPGAIISVPTRPQRRKMSGIVPIRKPGHAEIVASSGSARARRPHLRADRRTLGTRRGYDRAEWDHPYRAQADLLGQLSNSESCARKIASYSPAPGSCNARTSDRIFGVITSR